MSKCIPWRSLSHSANFHNRFNCDSVWCYDFCYGEELIVHITCMPDGDKYKLQYQVHHQNLMRTILELVVSKWHVHTSVLTHVFS